MTYLIGWGTGILHVDLTKTSLLGEKIVTLYSICRWVIDNAAEHAGKPKAREISSWHPRSPIGSWESWIWNLLKREICCVWQRDRGTSAIITPLLHLGAFPNVKTSVCQSDHSYTRTDGIAEKAGMPGHVWCHLRWARCLYPLGP